MKLYLQKYGTVIAYAGLFLFFAVASDNFLNPYNLMNVLKQISYLTIIALGFTLALITAELDLSFANIGSLCSVITAALLHSGHAVILAMITGIAIGIFFGLINGLLVTRLKIPSLITTLATATIANGVAFMLTGGVAYVGKLPDFFLFFGRGKVLGVSVLIIWMGLAVIVFQFFIKQTRMGMHMLSTGESENAARLSGINVRQMKILGLTLSGLAAGITGILLTSSLSSASATIAGDFLMSGIAAVLLGMTTIEPGKPNALGTLIGALIIGTLTNGLTLLGAAYYIQDILLGVIILASVSLSASQMMHAAFGVSH
jgi:ribose transport system permease protein